MIKQNNLKKKSQIIQIMGCSKLLDNILDDNNWVSSVQQQKCVNCFLNKLPKKSMSNIVFCRTPRLTSVCEGDFFFKCTNFNLSDNSTVFCLYS